MDTLTNTKRRLLYYAEKKGLTKESLFRQIQIDGANFRGRNAKSELSVDKVERILRAFPDLSPDWLILGSGPMLRKIDVFELSEQTFEYMQLKDSRIEELVRANQVLLEENQKLKQQDK